MNVYKITACVVPKGTAEQIRSRTKTVTSRLGWVDLKPGDLFCAQA